MRNRDESQETGRSNDALVASDELAAQIAAAVFEWRLARARTSPASSRERSPSSGVVWMSGSTRPTLVTS
jgi:hypothetical protein